MARVGLGDLLRMASAPGALTASEPRLIRGSPTPLARRWGEHAALGMATPHIRFAGDVWGLFRGGARPLRAMLDNTPWGAL
eukprot:8395700-Lingulodinium_polyedra.AAC.1